MENINNKRVCQVKTDEGSVVNAIYDVKTIEEVIASHFVNGASVCKNERYPAELQPRNREGVMLSMQVSKMAQSSGESPKIQRGICIGTPTEN